MTDTEQNEIIRDSYETIKHLGGLSHVREKPGMYAGDYMGNEYNSALMNMLREVVFNSVDEFLAGYAKKITVKINPEAQEVSVSDDGRGIPFGPTIYTDPVSKNTYEVDSLFMATGVANTGGKYDRKDSGNYKFSLGTHGIGLKMVCALSTTFKVTSKRGGKEANISYMKGEVTSKTQTSDLQEPFTTGTTVLYVRDGSVLAQPFEYNLDHVKRYLHEVVYLNPGLVIEFINVKTNESFVYSEPNGIEALLDAEIQSKGIPCIVKYPTMVLEEVQGNKVEVALAFVQGSSESYQPFVNGGRIEQASTPVVALRKALAQTLSKYTKEYAKLSKKDQAVNVTTDDFRSGVVCIIKILHKDPAYDSQTKTKLVNSDVATQIATDIPEVLFTKLVANPVASKQLIDQAILNAQAREAASKARQSILKKAPAIRQERNISLDIYTPPFSTNPDECRIFLFEGRSASNSLIKAGKAKDPKTGRLFKETNAVLALRGMVLNMQEFETSRALKNVELATLIHVVGLNPNDPNDLSNLKFKQIVVASDADAGGAKIFILLTTFFLFHFPKIIELGYLYRVETPRWEVTVPKTGAYHPIYVSEGIEQGLDRLGFDKNDVGKVFDVKTVKGLGELSAKGTLTLVDEPKLVQIQTEDLELMRSAFQVFNHSNFVKDRKELIFEEGLLSEEDVAI